MGYIGELHIYFSFNNTYQVLLLKMHLKHVIHLGHIFMSPPNKTNILTPVPVLSRLVLKISS